MKKSVVIIIGVIYGLSIIFVTLFGLKHKTFNEIIYVSQVEIIEPHAQHFSDGTKYITLSPDENGVREYQLVWVVTPENATNANVTFDWDKQKTNVSLDEETGIVTFTSQGAVDVTITAADGTSKSDKIKIIFIK